MAHTLRYRLKHHGAKFVLKKTAVSWGISIARLVLIVGICYIILYPFIEKFLLSFLSPGDLLDPTVSLIPRTLSLEFYRRALEVLEIPATLPHSIKLSLISGVLQTIFCTVVAYGFARFKTKFSSILFGFVIFTLLVPTELILSPLYLQFRFFLGGLNLLNTEVPFVILSVTCQGIKNGLYIYMLRQFFRGMPIELEEAAYMDGYGVFRTFLFIMLPNARSMMVTIFLFSFAWQWTDIIYTDSFYSNAQTLANAVIQNVEVSLQDMVYADTTRKTAMLLVILPLLIIYIFCQKAFIQSVERSGLVG